MFSWSSICQRRSQANKAKSRTVVNNLSEELGNVFTHTWFIVGLNSRLQLSPSEEGLWGLLEIFYGGSILSFGNK